MFDNKHKGHSFEHLKNIYDNQLEKVNEEMKNLKQTLLGLKS